MVWEKIGLLFNLIKTQAKPLLKWLVPLVTLTFLGLALQQHWQQVRAVQIQGQGWLWLSLAFVITFTAFVWSGWLWGSLFGLLGYPVRRWWATRLYLTTNIAKYLPSNLLHFYARVQQTHRAGVPLGLTLLIVTLEPLLMVAAGLGLTLITLPGLSLPLQGLSLGLILLVVHPRCFNPLLQRLAKRPPSTNASLYQLQTYPLVPLLGELLFISLRAAGFLFTLQVFSPLALPSISPLVGAYCLGWVLGMITPGAPGGIGVFELTVIQVLHHPQFAAGLAGIPDGTLLAAVAFYRLVSILAEALSAVAGWIKITPSCQGEPPSKR